MIYDSIIIGKGPAGITSAIYIKRAGLNPLVIGKDAGSLEKADKIDNYYGFENEITGKEIFLKGLKQAENLNIDIIADEVIDIQFNDKFIIKTRNAQYETKTVVLATGSNRKTPKIKGVKEFEGRGVSYCAVCDAFFYRNKKVAVLGEGDYALNEVDHLKPVVKSIVLLTNGKKPLQSRSVSDIEINQIPIQEINGDEKVENITLSDQTKIDLDGIFIAMGVASSSDLARKLGAILDEKNNIVIDENGMTNIPGLFAAGDCTGGILQISKAIYEGTKAGLAIKKYLTKG